MLHPKDKPPQVLPKLYLGVIDFDSAVYRCAAVHEDDEDGLSSAKVTLMSFVQDNIVNPCQCEEYLFIVTGQENFRHDLAFTKPYKGQRAQEKPIHYLPLFDWAIEHFGCLVADDMEADDYAVNIHQKYQGNSVLIAIDKDGLQSSGWHYNFVKKEARFISQEEAQWCLAFQMLRGDPGDNIPGLAGIGEAKARQFFEDSPELPPMRVVYNVYKSKGLLGDLYNEQYALLYMLRDTIIDAEAYFTKHKAVTEFEEVEGDFTGVDEGAPNVTL
jgi:hypothetical protein